MRNGETIISDPFELASHAVQYFTNNFCFAGNCRISEDLMEVTYELLDTNMNIMLTMIPSIEEISKVVFSLNFQSSLYSKHYYALHLYIHMTCFSSQRH